MLKSRASILAGICFMVLATACFAVLDTAAKFTSASVPALMAITVRYLVQAVLSTAVLYPVHGRRLFRVRHPRLQILRGMIFSITTFTALLALQYMPVGEFAALVMLVPMLVTVLAVSVLKEKLSAWHWLFVSGGLVGALVIVRPGGHVGLYWWVLLPLACVAFSTVFQLLSSHLGRHENPAATHTWTVYLCAVLGLLGLPWTWSGGHSAWTWFLLVLMGVAGAAGHFILAQAYQRAPASTLMPYMYFQIAFSVLGSWLVFAHVPDAWTWAGMGLVAVCGVASAWLAARERQPAAVLPET